MFCFIGCFICCLGFLICLRWLLCLWVCLFCWLSFVVVDCCWVAFICLIVGHLWFECSWLGCGVAVGFGLVVCLVWFVVDWLACWLFVNLVTCLFGLCSLDWVIGCLFDLFGLLVCVWCCWFVVIAVDSRIDLGCLVVCMNVWIWWFWTDLWCWWLLLIKFVGFGLVLYCLNIVSYRSCL